MASKCSPFRFNTTTINAVFAEEIAALGGRVLDTLDDGNRLYARAMLPAVKEVQPRDKLQGGVALRATDDEVVLCPYVFRQVCTNGLVVSQSGQARRFTLSDFDLFEPFLFEFRSAIQSACQFDELQSNVERMRAALTQSFSRALIPLAVGTQLSLFRTTSLKDVIRNVLAEFDRERDHTRFGLMNALTAVGRDTRDPELRWRLEECGAHLGLGPKPIPMLSKAIQPELPADSWTTVERSLTEDADMAMATQSSRSRSRETSERCSTLGSKVSRLR